MKHNKPIIQDHFLNQCRKDRTLLRIYLKNGVPINGHLTEYDSFTLLILDNGKQHFIYKQAVASIIPVKPIILPPMEILEHGDRQDRFFTQCQAGKIPLTVYLISGKPLIGTISHFDTFTMVLNGKGGQQSFIYKHAVSTISPARKVTIK
ncbi:RNA chaperone Hfq [Paenibacillus sp. FSL K6-2859]|uniref:RNA chaperone Hfq n=1 Tax=Paenibacillus sp. FSL K6-2859 TaxID=2921482 RepID=UPI0030F4E324